MELVIEGVFCPRVDEEGYPNILESLDMKLFDELINDLESINYEGRIAFSGFVNLYYQKT